MQKEIKAALAAATKYAPRNEGDRGPAALIVNLLSDTLTHAEGLESLAETWERQERVRVAQHELNAAQSA